MSNTVRYSYVIVLLLLFSTPLVHGIITVETDVEALNNQMLISYQVSPNLNLTSQLIILNDTIQHDTIWYNLTEAGGLVSANLTRWNITNTVTFLINNATLTNLYVWMNTTEPEVVYLDTVNNASAWSYAANVLKINATDNTNVTITWIAPPAVPGVANISGLVIVAVIIGIPLFFIILRREKK